MNVMLLNPNADGVAEVIVEEGVKVVTTGAEVRQNTWICGRRQE